MESGAINLSVEDAEAFLRQLSQDNSLGKQVLSGESHRYGSRMETHKRRAIKSIENLIKDLPDDQSRLDYLFARYEDLLQRHSVTQIDLRADRKEICTLRRIIEERKTEELRNVEARKRLEILYKDLQVQNKCLKEETLALHKDEEQKRLQVVEKFQKTLAEVTVIVQENVRKNTKLQEDKIDIQYRLTLLDKSYQQREQQVQCLEKQLQLEESLGKAGLLKATVEVDDIKTAWAAERDEWLQTDEYNAKLRLDDKTRINTMQLTLDGYIDKMESLEYKHTTNREKGEKYKEDLCFAQSENITLLKKVRAYKERFGGYAKKRDEMKGALGAKETEVKGLAKKVEKLERMCRKLQLDRALFLKLLQDNHIDMAGDVVDVGDASQENC